MVADSFERIYEGECGGLFGCTNELDSQGKPLTGADLAIATFERVTGRTFGEYLVATEVPYISGQAAEVNRRLREVLTPNPDFRVEDRVMCAIIGVDA